MAVTDFTAQPRAAAPDKQAATGRLHPLVWVYLLAVIIPMGIQVGPLTMTGLRLLLIVMVIPLMVRLLSGAYGRLYATDILFILHIIWVTLALLANNPGQVIEQTGSVGMEFLGGYAMGRAYIRTRVDFIALARALIGIVLVMLPFAMFETITGRSVWIEILRALPGIRTVAETPTDPRSLFGITLQRVQLGFSHPIHFGLFCSVTFSMCFVALNGTFGTTRRWITGGLLAFATCLSLSSGALLAIALQFGMILWAAMFARITWRWWLLLGLAVLAYIAVDLLSNRTPVEVFMSYATFSPHNAYWRALIFEWGMKNVWMNPFLGIGLNDWIRPAWMHTSSVDNFWLLIAMRYGIPAFVLVTLGYVLVVAHVMRRNFDDDPVLRQIRRAWVFTFLGLSFTLCTVHVWTAIYSFTFFLLGAGVWLIAAIPQDPAGPKENQAQDHRTDGPVFARDFGTENPVTRDPQTSTHPRAAPSRYSRFTSSDES